MTRSTRIRELFDGAVGRSADQRETFLMEHCADEDTRREVRALIAAYDAMGLSSEDGRDQSPDWTGRRLGPYQVERLLGEGGMGRVYLARRADGAFDRQVAIKVVRPQQSSARLTARLQAECRLLARLDNVGIARLLDVDKTPEGQTYLVLEYVDGLAITTFCARHRLSLAERVSLFIRLCEAVSHAHALGIVHCDLKPANILVTAAGQPKILDFGISRLLTPAGVDHGFHDDPGAVAGTPGYISPERVEGRTVEPASDVYSLGVLFHELLTGRRPPSQDETPTMEVAGGANHAATAEGAARLLGTDLYGILVTALAGDIARRYATVDALSEDLRAWQDRRPVRARRPWSRRYLLGRFARRNAVSVTVAAAIALGLVGTTVALAALWQRAEAARATAQRRFDDTRSLAASLLDIDTQLADLPGALATRRAITQTSAQYLERLASDLGTDRQLAAEVAEGYRRLGDALGNPQTPNLGDRAGALRRYDEADRALNVAKRQPGATAALREIDLRLQTSRGDVLAAQNRRSEAKRAYESALTVARALAAEAPDNWRYQSLVSGVLRPLGDLARAEGEPGQALKTYDRAEAIDQRVVASRGGDPDAIRLLALTKLRQAAARADLGEFAGARALYAEVTTLMAKLAERFPSRANLARDHALGLAKLGAIVAQSGDGAGLRDMETAIEELRRIAKAERINARAQRDLMATLVQYADVLPMQQRAVAKGALEQARTLALLLAAEPLRDEQAGADLAAVEASLARLAIGAATPPDVRFYIETAGQRRPVTRLASAAIRGTQLLVAPVGARAGFHYILVFGATGPASFLGDGPLNGSQWRVPLDAAPAQTVLFLTTPAPMTPAERTAILEEIGRESGPRLAPDDGLLRWRPRAANMIETNATMRGTDVALDWAPRLRARLERLRAVEFNGLTLRVLVRPPTS